MTKVVSALCRPSISE